MNDIHWILDWEMCVCVCVCVHPNTNMVLSRWYDPQCLVSTWFYTHTHTYTELCTFVKIKYLVTSNGSMSCHMEPSPDLKVIKISEIESKI